MWYNKIKGEFMISPMVLLCVVVCVCICFNLLIDYIAHPIYYRNLKEKENKIGNCRLTEGNQRRNNKVIKATKYPSKPHRDVKEGKMINKILCFIFGHKDFYSLYSNHKFLHCSRCSRFKPIK